MIKVNALERENTKEQKYKLCFQITNEQNEKIKRLPRDYNLSETMRAHLDEVLTNPEIGNSEK